MAKAFEQDSRCWQKGKLFQGEKKWAGGIDRKWHNFNFTRKTVSWEIFKHKRWHVILLHYLSWKEGNSFVNSNISPRGFISNPFNYVTLHLLSCRSRIKNFNLRFPSDFQVKTFLHGECVLKREINWKRVSREMGFWGWRLKNLFIKSMPSHTVSFLISPASIHI